MNEALSAASGTDSYQGDCSSISYTRTCKWSPNARPMVARRITTDTASTSVAIEVHLHHL
jgi:hypothetical protein